MRSSLLILLVVAIASNFLSAQQKNVVFNNKFQFVDGIYLTYEEFINNKPTYKLSEVRIKEKNTRFFNKKKIKSIKFRDKYGKKQKVDMCDVWGVCMNQTPYIQYQAVRTQRVNVGTPKLRYTLDGDFTRIRILGNICHFNIEDVFSANDGYFDASPHQISNSKLLSVQKILKTKTGEVRDFTPVNLQHFMKDDSALYSHYIKHVEDRENKIFLYLQKYNERNPFSMSMR